MRRLILIVCVLTALCSCRTQKTVQNESSSVLTVTVHDTVYQTRLQERFDSIVYIYRNDTVMIDRWHNRTKVDTVYRNFTEYVHDTVRVTETLQPPKSVKWSVKDDLKTFLACVGLSVFLLLGLKLYNDKRN